jgi:hypothetical protein
MANWVSLRLNLELSCCLYETTQGFPLRLLPFSWTKLPRRVCHLSESFNNGTIPRIDQEQSVISSLPGEESGLSRSYKCKSTSFGAFRNYKKSSNESFLQLKYIVRRRYSLEKIYALSTASLASSRTSSGHVNNNHHHHTFEYFLSHYILIYKRRK